MAKFTLVIAHLSKILTWCLLIESSMVSGLAAAKALKAGGKSVIILEARDRIGNFCACA